MRKLLTRLTAPPVAAQTVLRYSNWLQAGYPVRAQILDVWMVEVEKTAEGRGKIEIAPR
ncbi:MAG: hypothetical protein P4L96_11215 [Rhodoferax sp.]|nr:hypothetical protein [Rhodoferax sp.]